jgi:4-amino-4-deoxy-L-arabinose transferase-like glycosyltransferase
MTAWLAKLGLLLCDGWVHPLSLRLAFVLMFAGSVWVLYRWTASWFGERAGLAAAIALNLSAYYTAAGGLFVLPDGPFLFFALITMWQLGEALARDRAWAWFGVGTGFAGAMLSKYHGIFLPAGAVLYVLITPNKRRVLLTAGPYLAVAMGAIGFLPVVYWNSQNEWASFKFQGGRAVGFRFRPEGILAWTLGPILYLLPWIWFAAVRELLPRLNRFREVAGIERLLVCLSVGPLAFFLLVSCLRWVLLHWNLIGFVPLYPLVGRTWDRLATANPAAARYWLRGMVLGLMGVLAFAFVQARFGLIPFPEGIKDPTADISGWESVVEQLEDLGLLNDPNQFLITNRWYDSGQLAFNVRNRVPVVCYNSIDARGFAFWSRPEDWIGRNGLLVLAEEPDEDQVLKEMQQFFTKVELVADFQMIRGGSAFRPVRVFRCIQQKHPYPFSYRVVKAPE